MAPRASSRLVSLTVEGFRAYKERKIFDLDASVVVLYGPNGLGKTSLFDAIDYAATGRIGRLCNRQRRTQSDFSRLATHLDKTPGSGSVDLTIRSGITRDSSDDWTLQRSTGNWTSAWIDGKECDRKAVLNKLTQAIWVDNSPRQQTLESLFRATHLFGQGEQELLSEFQKGSVIPESFISEMLALQDYSQGLSKVGEVIAHLSSSRSFVDKQVGEATQERTALSATISPLAVSDADRVQPLPLEEAVVDLRSRADAVRALDSFPTDVSNTSPFEEWAEIVSARLNSRMQDMRSILSMQQELPQYERQSRQIRDLQLQLKRLEAELNELQQEEHKDTAALTLSNSELEKVSRERTQLEQKRRDLSALEQTELDRKNEEQKLESLRNERDRQIGARETADSNLRTSEPKLSKALTEVSELEQAAVNIRTRRALIANLVSDVGPFQRDIASLTTLANDVEQAREELRKAIELENASTTKLRDARQVREALAPAYERAAAQQAELEGLLDSIQLYLDQPSCPLCGTEFETIEALRERIRAQRNAASSEKEITVRFKEADSIVAQAETVSRSAKTNLMAAEKALRDIQTRYEATKARETTFRTRLLSASISGSEPEKGLMTEDQELVKKEQENGDAAVRAGKLLDELKGDRVSEHAKLATLNARISSLEKDIAESTSVLAGMSAKLAQGLKAFESSIEDLSRAGDSLAEKVAVVERSIADLLARKQIQMDNVNMRSVQRSRVDRERTRTISDLEQAEKSIEAFRNRLRGYGLAENTTRVALDALLSNAELDGAAMQQVLERARILIDAMRARDARLQLAQRQIAIDALDHRISKLEAQAAKLAKLQNGCTGIEKLLQRERQSAIERHIAAYGPMITTIQQRLRSVYGFGGVHLEARGGEATVQVEWRNQSVHVPPTDFFSDSQRQILMLSIFLAGGLRQNWSGFAPMLLDDPVTHFDDLNAYGFVELARGIVATSPEDSQLIISTCEERLFNLMHRKFSRLPSGAIFYEFIGMAETGPIVERR